MSKKEKVKDIICKSCGGWNNSEILLEKITEIITEKLHDVPDDYEELLSAYIRL